MTISESLRAARQVKSMRQRDAAEALGVSVATVNRWETGKSEPIASQLASLSRLYGVSTEVLCGIKPLVG